MNEDLTPDEVQLKEEFKAILEKFSAVLLEKLMANEKKYGFGNSWKLPDWEEQLQQNLLEHIKKGDPRDTAIFSLFAWYHGWPTSPQERQLQHPIVEELDFNEPIPHEPKTCVKCGKLTKTVSCVIEAVQEEDSVYPAGEHCYDCCVKEGYCFGCGRFSAGQQAYDFGSYPGYCENCQEHIRSNMCDDWDDNDYDHSVRYGTP